MSVTNEPVSSTSKFSEGKKKRHQKKMMMKGKEKDKDVDMSKTRTFDFTFDNPAKSMHLNKELLNKCMQMYLEEKNDNEYHHSLDYGLNEGPWDVRCVLAEWLNELYNSINLSCDQLKQDAQEKQQGKTSSSSTFATLTAFPKLTDDTSDSSSIGYRAHNLFLTAGVSDAMRLCCSALIDPCAERNIILCEDPTYAALPGIINTFHGEILPVETSPTFGINVSNLKQVLTQCREHDVLKRIAFLYLIPIHHNPLGVSLSMEIIQQIIHLAHEFDIYIVSDESYLALDFPNRSGCMHGMSLVERMIYPNLDFHEYKVFSVSAMSNIIGPGLRCGWIHTFNEDIFYDQLSSDGILNSGGCLSNFTFSLLKYIWTSKEVNRHLQNVKEQLYRRFKIMYEEIIQYNKTAKMELLKCTNMPSGGHFMWIELPENMTGDELKNYMEKKNIQVMFTCGDGCSSSLATKASSLLYRNDNIWHYEKYKIVQKQNLSRYVRLCFAYLSENEIREGAREFAKSVYELHQEKHPL